MKRLAKIKKYTATGLGVSALALSISMAYAAPVTVELCTGTTTFDPAGANVPMWGFGTDAGAGCVVSVPGPEITANEGDVVTINLTNNLAVPVSLIVTGHNVADGGVNAGPDPVFNVNGRVRSLVAEAAAAGGTATYVVTAKAGSFIYHSATHQQVQVQMGLYGAMASSPLTPTYDNAITMFYSEIDPALHAAVAANDFGAGLGTTSTMIYKPQYFLVNGAASDGSAPIAAGDTGQDILVRMFNAGLKSRTMQTLGTNMTIVAKNGSATPYGMTRITADVHALGTTDVIINTATAGDYRLYDRRLAHSNGVTAGGINSTLTIAAGAGAPVAGNDIASVSEDTPTLINVVSNDGTVDATTVAVVTDPVHGSAASNGDGTVTYSPDADYNGADSFTYTVENAGVTSNVASVGITVIAVNDNPVASDDAVNIVEGTQTNLAVLANDSDADGDTLSIASVDTTVTLGSVVMNGTSVDYTPAVGAVAGSIDSFTYIATDGSGNSASATCAITIVAPAGNIAPVAVDETVTFSRAANSFVDPVSGAIIATTIAILANDSDADGNLDPASVALSLTSKRDKKITGGVDQGSSVLLLGSGQVSYTPPVSGGGSDVFTYTVADNLGEVSNTATVRINLVK